MAFCHPFFLYLSNTLIFFGMKHILRTIACLCVMTLWVLSCDTISPVETPVETPADPPVEIPADDTVKLEMTEFKLLYYHNDNKFSDIIRFDIGETEIVAHIDEPVDLTSLVVDFSATSDVYVGDVKQVSGKTANDFSQPIIYRIENEYGRTREYKVILTFFTGIPVVYFNTASGVNVANKENWEDATIRIVDPRGVLGMEETDVLTKGRGNSTWNFKAKQPYALKFEKRTSVMGMPKHKRWILMANYRDRTMIRNAVAFEIANRTGLAWTPRVEFAELVMNGKHKGNYMVTEQVRVDENRVNVVEMEKTDNSGEALTGGYLLEVDQWDDEQNMFKSLCMENKWGNNSCTIMLKFPDPEDCTTEQFSYIKDYIWTIERLMMNGDFQTIYDDYIDMDSFIDFFFIQELTGNKEPWRGPYSSFMYKDRGGKLYAGPVWDFDFTTFMWHLNCNAEKFYNEKSAWYKYFLKDPIFRKRMKERWGELKEGFSTIPDYIDELVEYLSKSAVKNVAMFSPGTDADLGGLMNGDETLPYDEAISSMKLYYETKFNWIDGQLAQW